MNMEATNKTTYEPDIDFSKFSSDIKPIALYLPQFHEIPENNKWWGQGFTEWTNVKKAEPKFDGHYQPRVPDDAFGYYDLSEVQVLEKQAKLARNHGIYAFGVYYYWFSGKRLLEKPIDLLLEHPEIDFPFFLIWANENWTRTWDGLNSSVLIKQEYSEEDPIKFVQDIKKYVDDQRYMRVDGKPVIGIYNLKNVPEVAKVLSLWRKTAIELGIGEILIWSCKTDTDAAAAGASSEIDAEYDFPPRGKSFVSSKAMGRGVIWNYEELLECEKKVELANHHPVYRGSMLSWDNSPRKKNDYHLWRGYTHRNFYIWNRIIANYTRLHLPADNRFIFVNAWNEWGKGTYLEPDQKYGYAAINALSKAIFDLPYDDTPFFVNGGLKKCEGWNVSFKANTKIAVQIHLFYLDLIPEIILYLSNLVFPFDLYISTDSAYKK